MSRTIARGAFYGLALGVWLWMMLNTLSITRMVFPSQDFLGALLPYMALVMFDVGAVAWLFVFLRYSEGVVQRSIAMVVSFISLVGGVFLSVAHLYLGGQTLVQIPSEMGSWVLWAIGGMTLIHGVAIWASHLASPEEMRLIKIQSLLDNGKKLALDRTEALLNQRLDGIADAMSAEYANNIETELRRHAGVMAIGQPAARRTAGIPAGIEGPVEASPLA